MLPPCESLKVRARRLAHLGRRRAKPLRSSIVRLAGKAAESRQITGRTTTTDLECFAQVRGDRAFAEQQTGQPWQRRKWQVERSEFCAPSRRQHGERGDQACGQWRVFRVDWIVSVIIGGWSFGGYAALSAALEKPGRYRCVVSIAGVTHPYQLVVRFGDTTRWSDSSLGISSPARVRRSFKPPPRKKHVSEMPVSVLFFVAKWS
ncbi:MAG: prolyl oligopeptidase family serine peptidase [bacterium]|nr:prolyl oligopeptidase family serine peptidase [bacterium]